MDRLKIGLGAALAVALGMASAAPAATNSLDGKVIGDDDSKVSAKVRIEDRVPTRILDLSFRKVDFSCPSGQKLEGSVDAPDSVRVGKNGNFEASDKEIEIKGEVRLKGRKIVGKLEAAIEFGGERCKAKGEFKAR